MNSNMLIAAKPKRSVPKEFKKVSKKMARQPKKKVYGAKNMASGYRGP